MYFCRDNPANLYLKYNQRKRKITDEVSSIDCAQYIEGTEKPFTQDFQKGAHF